LEKENSMATYQMLRSQRKRNERARSLLLVHSRKFAKRKEAKGKNAPILLISQKRKKDRYVPLALQEEEKKEDRRRPGRCCTKSARLKRWREEAIPPPNFT